MLQDQRTKVPLTFAMCCRSSRSVAPDATTRRPGFTTGWITHPPIADRWEIRRRVWDSWKGWYYKEAMPLPSSPESLAFTDAERLTIRNWVGSGAVRGVAPAPAARHRPIKLPDPQLPRQSSKPGSSQPNATAPAGDVQAGRGLFVSVGCVACHKIEGKGGMVGPDLSHEAKLGRSSQWLITQITDPTKHDPTTIMPAHKNLTPTQLKGLADYILNPAPGSAPVSAQSSAATPPVATNAPAAAPTAPAPTNQVAATATSHRQSGKARDSTSGFYERTGTCRSCLRADQSSCSLGRLRRQSGQARSRPDEHDRSHGRQSGRQGSFRFSGLCDLPHD